MTRATIADAEHDLRALIERARAGEEVVITDSGHDVVRLEPLSPSGREESDDERLDRLEREGVIRRGRGGPLARVLEPFPKDAVSSGVLDALLAERDEDYR